MSSYGVYKYYRIHSRLYAYEYVICCRCAVWAIFERQEQVRRGAATEGMYICLRHAVVCTRRDRDRERNDGALSCETTPKHTRIGSCVGQVGHHCTSKYDEYRYFRQDFWTRYIFNRGKSHKKKKRRKHEIRKSGYLAMWCSLCLLLSS